MSLTKRVYTTKQKVLIYGSGSIGALLALLVSLSFLGVTITTSGDIVCAGTYEDPCVSYFNISLSNYTLCFGSTFKGVYFDDESKVSSWELYKADLRYRPDNPARWKPYNFTAGVCLEAGKTHEFKLVGYKKNPKDTVKWGTGYGLTEKDPIWMGVIAKNDFIVTISEKHDLTEHEIIFKIKNLQSTNRNFNLQTYFKDTNFDLSKLSDVYIYEWKPILKEFPTYDTREVCYEVENNQTGGKEKTCYNETYQNGTETKRILAWKESKMLLIVNADKASADYGNIQIPKIDSKCKYDDFGTSYDCNGEKMFKITWKTPITETDKGWGSSGYYAIIDKNTGLDYDPWWNSTWILRRNITINNTGNTNTLTDYQVAINLTYDSDMQSDFSDIRFTWYNATSGAEVEIPYWIENKSNSQWAYVWVKVPYIPASSYTTVYVYYKNSTIVESKSKGEDVFPLFDDFQGTALNTTKWSRVNEGSGGIWNYTVSDGWLKLNATPDILSGCNGFILNSTVTTSFENGISYLGRTKVYMPGTQNINIYYLGFKNSTYIFGVDKYTFMSCRSGWCSVHQKGVEGIWTNVGPNPWSKTWLLNMTVNRTKGSIWLMDINKAYFYNSTSDNLFNFWDRLEVFIGLRDGCGGTTGWASFDYVIVRKYASPEPTYSIGEEISKFYLTSCSVLEESGTYYLNADIKNSTATTCINITANNVVLDCQGHIIDGKDTSNTYGIYARRASLENTNITVKNCIVTDWDRGIYLQYAQNNNVTNSIINSNSYGISLSYSNNNQIINSTFNNNSYGISLSYSNNNQIINSTSSGNTNYGIHLLSSNNNQIINSTLSENGVMDFSVYAPSDTGCNNYLENVIGSNNLPIKYFNYSIVLSNEILSELILCNADYSSITNVTINASSLKKNNALLLHRTDYSNFTRINSCSNSYGISLFSSNNNQIINSTFNNNSYGISLSYSNNNQIINSTSSGNTNYGIHLPSSNNNQIINSTFNNNSYGIYFDSSSNNTVYSNKIQGSLNYGIYLFSSGSTPNLIYNNLFNNTNNFYFAGTVYTNKWNTTRQAGTRIYSQGTEIGGNYWTNPMGTGYSDTCSDYNGDTFCDEPYVLYENNIDYLPLSASEVYLDSCNSLEKSGATYYLKTDLDVSLIELEPCFNLYGDNIIFDCQGHLVRCVEDTLENCYVAFRAITVDNITLRNCRIKNFYIGADFEYSNFARIINNTFENNRGGVAFFGYNSTIYNNTFVNNNYWDSYPNYAFLLTAFDLDEIRFNNFTFNRFINNSEYGFWLAVFNESEPAYLDSNYIYNNLFNQTNIMIEVGVGENYWNVTKQEGERIVYSESLGYIGGNYWTNPMGTGYSDTCSDYNGDTFCDEPYVLYENNIDYLPYSSEYSEGVISINVSFGPPNTNLLRWNENSTGYGCGPSEVSYWVEPENQTSTYGILKICNNGTVIGNVQAKLSGMPNEGWTIMFTKDNSSSKSNAIAMTTSYQTIYSSLQPDYCIYSWGYANCSNVVAGPGVDIMFKVWWNGG